MLRYFKINDPYRILTVFLFLLILRMLYWFGPSFIDLNMLRYFIVGERLMEGQMYAAVLDNVGPLSALVYYWIVALFGRSTFVFSLISLFLLTFQAFRINSIFNDRKSFKEYNFLPGLIFAIYNSLYFGMAFLPPVLLANTFLILAMKNIMTQIEFRVKRDEDIFAIGIYLGISSLFYLPFVFYLVYTFVLFIVFSSTIARRYLLVVFAFLLPHVFTGLYYLMTHNFENFITQFYANGFSSFVTGTSMSGMFFYYLPILLFVVWAIFMVFNRARFNNYQQRLFASMLLLLALLLITFLWIPDSGFNFILIFAIPTTFILTHYFLSFKRYWVGELFLILFTLLPVVAMLLANNFIRIDRIAFEKQQIKHDKQELSQDRIWVIGENYGIYSEHALGSKFFNYQLYKEQVENPEDLRNMEVLYRGIMKEMPDVIIDEAGILPYLVDKIPAFTEVYQIEGNRAILSN